MNEVSLEMTEVYLDANYREFLGILFIEREPSFQKAIDLSSYSGL